MKLEVGKKYFCRDGSGPVKIESKQGEPDRPFFASNGLTYFGNGRYLQRYECHHDLVEEWVEPNEVVMGVKEIIIEVNLPNKLTKPDWYWGFWELNYKHALENIKTLDPMNFADAACAERMKREK